MAAFYCHIDTEELSNEMHLLIKENKEHAKSFVLFFVYILIFLPCTFSPSNNYILDRPSLPIILHILYTLTSAIV